MRQKILDETRSFLLSQSLHENMLKVATTALQKLTLEAQASPPPVFLPCLDLPVLVAQALGKSKNSLIPPGRIATLLYLGIDLLDDVADGDTHRHWVGLEPAHLQLAATTLIASLAPLAIGEMDVSAELQNRFHKTIAGHLLKMSSGQSRDLGMTGRNPVSLEEVEEAIRGKSGEEAALFAALGALWAEASLETCLQYVALGRWVGMAAQIASDCHDLFQSEDSRDLIQGKRTLPIVFALSRMGSRERSSFHQSLEAARHDPSLRPGILQEIERHGARRFASIVVENYCQKALSVLDSVCPEEAVSPRMRDMIRSLSFFSSLP